MLSSTLFGECSSNPTHAVLISSYRLKVVGFNTKLVIAGVVNGKPFRHRSLIKLVGYSVRQALFKTRVIVNSLRYELPATSSLVDSRPKALDVGYS